MIQAFVPEIMTAGELSLVFLAGRFSHAFLKRAVPGEFRVQVEFGGSETPATASDAAHAFAESVLLAAGQRGLPCASYTPQQVKGAVCGSGRAAKDQVQRMVIANHILA